MTNATADGAGDLGDVLGVLWRRAAVIILTAALGAGAAYAISSRQQNRYEASATLLFRDSNVSELVTGVSTGTTGTPERNAATNLRLVSLETVAARTARRLGSGWTPQRVRASVQSTSQGQSDLVAVNGTDGTADGATRLANEYANAFVALRRANAKAQIDRARQRILDELDSGDVPRARRRQLTRDADNLRLLSSVQDGGVQLVQHALPPGSPASPNPSRDAVIGGLIGLLLGIALAFVVEQLDKRLRRPRDAERAFGLPVLAAVRRSRSLRRGVLNPDVLEPGAAEAFRRLRASLRHFRRDGEIRTVVVTSSEPDAGATTVATGLAAAAAHANARTLLIEADTRQPRLRRMLDTTSTGLMPLLRAQDGRMEDAVAHVALNGHPEESFDALVADREPVAGADLLDTARMEKLLDEARSHYDLVVVDVPPVTRAADAIPLMRRADGVVVVTRLGRDSSADAERMTRVLDNLDIKPLGVVATFARRRDSGYDNGRGGRRR